jgi:hypothetical protein
MERGVMMNPQQAQDALNLGEVNLVTIKCIMCSASMTSLVMGKIEQSNIPSLCDSCRTGLNLGRGHTSPVSLIGKNHGENYFMREFVDK